MLLLLFAEKKNFLGENNVMVVGAVVPEEMLSLLLSSPLLGMVLVCLLSPLEVVAIVALVD